MFKGFEKLRLIGIDDVRVRIVGDIFGMVGMDNGGYE